MGNLGKVTQLCEYEILDEWLQDMACFRPDLSIKSFHNPMEVSYQGP